MRKNLLLIPFLLLTLTLSAQSAVKQSNAPATTLSKAIKIYPNPAVNFIGLNHVIGVGSITVYNLVGRKMKQFTAQKGVKYDVTDLPRGMYLVQLVGKNGKVVTTQRMSKQ